MQGDGFVDPAPVGANVVFGENRLPRKVVPIRLNVGPDVEQLGIYRPTACREVILPNPEKQARRNLQVRIGKGDDVGMEVAVKKVVVGVYLYFVGFIAQSGGGLIGYRVMTNV